MLDADVDLIDGSIERLFVVANYIVDTLPADAFRVNDGVLHIGTVATMLTPPECVVKAVDKGGKAADDVEATVPAEAGV